MQRWLLAVVVCAVVTSLPSVAGQASGQPELDPGDGQQLLKKLTEISRRENAPAEARKPLVIYQREINAYVRFEATREILSGVTNLHISLRNSGAVAVQATVNLSALRDAQALGPFDPLLYLSGRLPVIVGGVVRTQDGIAHVDVESVTIGGISMPSSMFAELVGYYSRNEEYPAGVDVTEPFDLPYGISELRVEHERVVVVQ